MARSRGPKLNSGKFIAPPPGEKLGQAMGYMAPRSPSSSARRAARSLGRQWQIMVNSRASRGAFLHAPLGHYRLVAGLFDPHPVDVGGDDAIGRPVAARPLAEDHPALSPRPQPAREH